MPNYDEFIAEVRAEGNIPVMLEVTDCARTTLIFPAGCDGDMPSALSTVTNAFMWEGLKCEVHAAESEQQTSVLRVTGPEGVAPDAVLEWARDIAQRVIDVLEYLHRI